MIVQLADPIPRHGAPITKIELRPPGRTVVEAMTAARVAGTFTEAWTIRFAARLSRHTETTIGLCSTRDLAALRQGLKHVYHQGRRRLAARQALADAAKEARADHE